MDGAGGVMLIALDTQHKNKPRRPFDTGAGADLDGDGVIEREEREVELVGEYFARLRVRLEADGVGVLDGFSGTYIERNQAADRMGASLYLAGHMNAGGGTYGLVGVDHRAALGGTSRRLAGILADQWRSRLLLGRVRVEALSPSAPERWQRNAFATIGSCRCPALLLEPLFLDGHAHLLAPSRREATLDAIARGIHAAIASVLQTGPGPT